MVAKLSPTGLIATTRAHATRLLDELAERCDWPLLLDANPRRLLPKLAMLEPECVLFWLDDRDSVAATAQLIGWLHQRGPRPYRVAVAHQLSGDVEAVFRASGAHGFLMMHGRPDAFVGDVLWPMLQEFKRAAHSRATVQSLALTNGEHAAWESPPDLARPP